MAKIVESDLRKRSLPKNTVILQKAQKFIDDRIEIRTLSDNYANMTSLNSRLVFAARWVQEDHSDG